MARKKIAVIVGSLRKGSFNRKMAKVLISVAPATLECEVVEIRGLPLYDQDLDDSPPAAWTEFRERIRSSDGVLFVTPEYNRSVPGVLKNAIDVGSRPCGGVHGCIRCMGPKTQYMTIRGVRRRACRRNPAHT